MPTVELQQIFNNLLIDPESVDIHEHLPTLQRYAGLCNHVTEFGVRWVVSTWALLIGQPKTLVSYDINYHERIERVKRVAAENGVDFTFIRDDTTKISIDPTELLFIDTLHTYRQLSRELELHECKVSRFIILHDTTTFAHHGMGPEFGGDNVPLGLVDALNEFLSAHTNWHIKEVFINNNGLTVLERQD